MADKEVELKESILNLPVGASAEYHVSYEIKEGDIQAGKFTNTVEVKNSFLCLMSGITSTIRILPRTRIKKVLQNSSAIF